MSGAWDLYHQNWEQPGGSISIIEFHRDPPGSNYIHQELGELCGSSFWVFLSQRFHLLYPEQERYAAEIEKSIYNVALANQDGSCGLRYHTHLAGTKEQASRHNTCCEGQGTRLIGSLPEHIYSLADDGIYLNLYEPSTITWKQSNGSFTLLQKTKFPAETSVECEVDTASAMRSNIRIRVPSWAAREMEIAVNGKSAGVGQPGSYMALDRVWSRGDSISFTLPTEMRLVKYKGADQIEGVVRYSIEYGPILYAIVGGGESLRLTGFRSPGEIEQAIEPLAGSPLRYRLKGRESLALLPYWQVREEVFTCFPAVAQEQV